MSHILKISSQITKIHSKEEWWDKLKIDGYLGIQSGNYRRVYFFGENNNGRQLYTKTKDYDSFELKEHSFQEIDIALDSIRNFYVCNLKDIDSSDARDEIRQLQYLIFGKQSRLQNILYTDKFNEELL